MATAGRFLAVVGVTCDAVLLILVRAAALRPCPASLAPVPSLPSFSAYAPLLLLVLPPLLSCLLPLPLLSVAPSVDAARAEV